MGCQDDKRRVETPCEAVGVGGTNTELPQQRAVSAGMVQTRRDQRSHDRMLTLVNETVQNGGDMEDCEDEFKTISEQIEQLQQHVETIRRSQSQDAAYEKRLATIQKTIDQRQANRSTYDDILLRTIQKVTQYRETLAVFVFSGGNCPIMELLPNTHIGFERILLMFLSPRLALRNRKQALNVLQLSFKRALSSSQFACARHPPPQGRYSFQYACRYLCIGGRNTLSLGLSSRIPSRAARPRSHVRDPKCAQESPSALCKHLRFLCYPNYTTNYTTAKRDNALKREATRIQNVLYDIPVFNQQFNDKV